MTSLITRLQEKCPICGKVAIQRFTTQATNKNGDLLNLITLDCFHVISSIVPRGTPFESMVSNHWKPEIAACKHEWDKRECKKCGESRLLPFQVTGSLAAEAGLASQKGFGIFDDMGLGKTVQAIAQLRYSKELYTPTLIITKSSVKFQWFKEIVKWLGPSYAAQVISTGKDYILPGLKTYVIAYDLLRRFNKEKLSKLGLKLIILDECQQIKNADSTRTQEVRKLVGADTNCKVLSLSGTPWKNRGSEFFPVLNMMDPIKFHSYQYYLDHWVQYYFEGSKRKMGGIRDVKRFKEYTSNLLIRREFEEVIEEFPETNRMKLPVQLDELQQSAYDTGESDFADWYNQFVIGGEEDKVGSIEIIAQMSRMRHITGLAKIPATLSFIEEFFEEGSKNKLVVFIHHKDVGELMYSALQNCSKEDNPDWHELSTYLTQNGIRVFKFTSELSDVERYEMAEEFNQTKNAIMIASTLACGEGVNLQTCADCVLHERQWNPQNEDQAAPGRFRRIGQKATQINITNPEAEGTIDQDLDSIVERKRRYFHEAMNKGEVPNWSQDEIVKELADKILARNKAKKSKNGKGQTNITAMAGWGK
jgi:SNF2 family DNA or RNA helicase